MHALGISAGGRSLHHFTISRVAVGRQPRSGLRAGGLHRAAAPGSYLHGINVEALSSGNVWRRGVMHTGTFDSHRGLPFENLRTDIVLVNKDAVPGGAFEAGPLFGARTVHWGINVESGETLCMDITDAAPRSLTAGITRAGRNRGHGFAASVARVLPGRSGVRAAGVRCRPGELADLLELQRSKVPIEHD